MLEWLAGLLSGMHFPFISLAIASESVAVLFYRRNEAAVIFWLPLENNMGSAAAPAPQTAASAAGCGACPRLLLTIRFSCRRYN